MKKSLLIFAAAMIGFAGIASPTLASDAVLNDYSWAVLKDNPKFYWNFNEADGAAVEVVRGVERCELVPYFNATRTTSASGLGQTASFDGASLFGSAGITPGLMGDPDAATLYAELGMNSGWMSGAWAIELWVKSDGTDGGQYLVNNMGEPYAGDWPGIIFDYTADTPSLWTHTGQQTGAGGATISDTDWHHMVFTVYGNGAGDGSTANAKEGLFGVADRVDVAFDGVVTTNIFLGSDLNNLVNLQGALHVGAHNFNGGSGFGGSIDELAIYELGAMTEAEVAAKHVELAGHYGLASSAPAANVAFVDSSQVSYTWVGGSAENATYNDSTGRELLDGLHAISGNLDPECFAYSGEENYVEVVFDLGGSVNLDSIWVDYIGGNGKWGVTAPNAAEFTFSTDGVNFTGAQNFDDFNDDVASSGGWEYFSERRLQAEVGGVSATHVKMRLDKDFFAFLSEVQFLESTGGTGPGLEGDLNGDGFVGSADLDIVRGAWGQTVSGAAAGDPSGDGVVGSADLDIVRGNWGATASAAAVPEPAGLMMILLGTIGVLALRKRG